MGHSHRRLKIDRSFIENVAVDSVRRQVVSAIAQTASVLGITCVAEGIESFETIEVLRRMGVDVIQGFAVHRPEPLDQIEQTLRVLIEEAETRAAGNTAAAPGSAGSGQKPERQSPKVLGVTAND